MDRIDDVIYEETQKASYEEQCEQKEIREMNQSNYEKYAEVKQQELLHRERNLQHAIGCLRESWKTASSQYIDNAIDFVANLYNLSIDEVKRAIGGDQYWCI